MGVIRRRRFGIGESFSSSLQCRTRESLELAGKILEELSFFSRVVCSGGDCLDSMEVWFVRLFDGELYVCGVDGVCSVRVNEDTMIVSYRAGVNGFCEQGEVLKCSGVSQCESICSKGEPLGC